MTTSYLNIVDDEERKAILLLEVLGFIHDIGKLSDRFLKSKASDGTELDKQYKYRLFIDLREVTVYKDYKDCGKINEKVDEWLKQAKNIPCAFSERPDLTENLNMIRIKAWDKSEYSLAELVPFLSNPGLYNDNVDWVGTLHKGMQPGLLIGYMHGVAHFDKETKGRFEKQSYRNTWIGTPFGYDFEKILVEKPNGLTLTLQSLPLKHDEIINAIGSLGKRKEWLKTMRAGLSRCMADNQRPINDVTLWDWGYLVASLTKAAARNLFHRNGIVESFEKLEFQTLRIYLDKLGLYTDSDKISDLLGKKEEMDCSLSKARDLIEHKLVLGNRIFHDETGDYYLLPGDMSDNDKVILKDLIQHCFDKDLCPQVKFGKIVNAGDLDRNKSISVEPIKSLLTNLREDANKESRFEHGNNFNSFADEWDDRKERLENAEICCVCGLRPVGSPIKGSNSEQEKLLESWATQDKAWERHICRLCLSRRGRRAKKWAESEKNLSGPTIWSDEVADDRGGIALIVGTFGLKHWLDGSALECTRLSRNYLKNPSPARLYRITETTRTFWQNVNDDVIRDNQASKRSRLRFVPDNPKKIDQLIGAFHTCELKFKGITFACVWDCLNKHFLSIENLAGLSVRHGLDIEQLKTELKPDSYVLSLPSSYGHKGTKTCNVDIKLIAPSTDYIPVIPLLAESSLFMCLISAKEALKTANTVIEKYESEMNKVQDRLPLGIGLVFFPRRTPLRAVMEAGHSMRDMLYAKVNEQWCVDSNKRDHVQRTLRFQNGRSLTFSTSIGENEKEEDPWYLWCFKSEGQENGLKDSAQQLKDIKKGDTIRIYPGRFDFEFLDTAGRRFDICYDGDGRRARRTRPFYLADVKLMNRLWEHIRYLKSSQIHQIIRLIETKREEWTLARHSLGLLTYQLEDVFHRFVHDTLAGARWSKNHPWSEIDEKERNELVDAGFCGILTDVAELRLTILKSPLNEEQQA